MSEGAPTRLVATTPGWLETAATKYSQGQHLALLFDYDGTLTPIVRHPSLAKLGPEMHEVLERLSGLPGVQLGFISGRSLSELRRLVNLEPAFYAGSGGLEIELGGSTKRCPSVESMNQLGQQLATKLQPLLAKFPGTWIESKPGALSIHYRGLLPLAATCFRCEIAEQLATVPGVRHRIVSEAIEIVGQSAWHKGTAVNTMLDLLESKQGQPPHAIYFGDAPNDAEAMEAVLARHGHAVGIGTDAPEVALTKLRTPAEVEQSLRYLLRRIRWGADTASFVHVGIEKVTQGTLPKSTWPGCLLIIDPDFDFRTKLGSEMREFGWIVWQDSSPELVNEFIRQHPDQPHVVLVDLQLPGLQGGRMLSELGRGYPTVLRCTMSANINRYTAAAYGKLSNVPLLLKPFSAATLHTTLQALLPQRLPARVTAEPTTSTPRVSSS